MTQSAQLFRMRGKDLHREPYHYTECGLDDVYLLNGVTRLERGGEVYISIEDVEGLWKAIGLRLVQHQKTLAPKEIKFLRRQMDMTQAELGTFLRVSDQSVARWEKGAGALPGPADIALRLAFLGSPIAQPEGGKVLKGLREAVESLLQGDELPAMPAYFEQDDGSWRQRAAA